MSITISTGGTYSGTYTSSSSGTPAVTIATTAAVILDGATITHAGIGISWGSTGSINLTVRNCTVTALAPSPAGSPDQYAVLLGGPVYVDINHNSFTGGHGIYIDGTGATQATLIITCNDFQDISKQSRTASLVGAVHGFNITAPNGATVSWNRVTNHYGQSMVEDTFTFTGSNGTAANPIVFERNLVNGAYPYSGDGSTFTGGGFDNGDLGGSYITCRYNTAVRVTNNGFMIPAGTNITVDHCTCVNTGLADNGARVSCPSGDGITTYYEGTYATGSIAVTNCSSGYLRWNGSAFERSDYYLPFGANSGNTSLSTVNEAAVTSAIAAYEASVTANGITIGPVTGGGGGVVFDAVGPSSAGAFSATSPLSWTHTPAGAPSAVLAAIAVGVTAGTGSTGACTYGGTSMTRLAAIPANNSTSGYIELFGLLSPASGAKTVSYTPSATGTLKSLIGGSLSYTGATAFGTPSTAPGSGLATSGSVSVTGTSTLNRVAGFFCDGTGGQSVTAGTQRYLNNHDALSAAGNSFGADIASSGGTVTLSGSWTSDWWGAIAVELQSGSAPTGSGSPSARITITPSATGGTGGPASGSPSAGITITPSATGSVSGAGSPSAGITITPSATGLAGVPAGPPAFPARPLGIKAELNLNGTWTDITAYLRLRNPVQITNMGRADWTSTLQAAQLTLTLDNRDGRFTPKNSAGAYYPFIARNTQLRLSVSSQSATGDQYTGYRFCGEVTVWPPRWSVSGRDIYCDITAAGIWQRMSQLITTLGSAYRRWHAGQAGGAAPRAYWPCEDGTGSTGLIPYASPAGTAPATWAFASTGSGLSLAANSDFRGSDAITQLNAAAITFTVPAGGTATSNFTRFLLSVPKNGDSASGTTNWNLLEVDSAGTVAKFEVYLTAAGTLLMQLRNSGGTVIAQGTTTTSVKGQPYLVSAELAPSGGNVLFALSLIRPGAATITETISGTLTSATVGQVSSVKISRAMQLTDTAVGHLAVFYGAPPALVASAYPLNGYAGERAMDRFTRLCAEMGIAAETIGAPAATAPMGPQVDDTLSNLLQMIEDTDCGLLYESRSQFGLGYRSSASMANQAAAVVLPYTAGLLDPELAPVFDQQLTRNNITVTNWTGYTQGAILTAGPMSVLSPPAGVGNGYAYTRAVSAADDSQLPGIANFLLNLGTVDEIRLPVVTLKMVRAANAAYFAAVPALRPGDYFQITNMPAYGGPATAKQLVQGYSETLNAKEWTFTFNSSPETPWETGFSPGTVQLAQLPGGSATTSQAPGAGGSVIADGSVTPAMLNSGITIHTLGGNAVTISASAPAAPNLNDMWIASATGLMSQWNGTSWMPVLFDGTATIQAGTVTSALIRAGTITAGNIAAGTITSALLAAGIVVAGIVDATTITGATFIATGTSGEYLGYSGPPAAGNLVFSVSPAAGTDAQGNAYLPGTASYHSPGAGQWIAATMDGGTSNVYTAPLSAGPWTQIGSAGSLANDGNIHFSAHGGAYLVADTILYKQDPSGSGREAWHDMRPLANSFIGTISGQYPPQYRMCNDGHVEIAGSVQMPPGSGNFNNTTFFTMPSGYRPVNHTHSWPIGGVADGAATPIAGVDTSGALQFHFMPASGIGSTVVTIYGRYPLEITGLITS